MISELIYKKGFGRIGTKREALNSNEKIEENLGEKNYLTGVTGVTEIRGGIFVGVMLFIFV